MLLFLIGMSVGTCLGAVAMGVLLSAKPAKDITRESGDPEADDDDDLAAPGHRTDDRRMLEARSPVGRYA